MRNRILGNLTAAAALMTALGFSGTAQAQINVLTVDVIPLASPGFGQTTMGQALQMVDLGGDFIVTEVTPAFFAIQPAAYFATFDLIAINNDPSRIAGGIGTTWQQVAGCGFGRTMLNSHDAPRFHKNFAGPYISGPGPGPGFAPFGAPALVRQAALWAGGLPGTTGLLIFNDALNLSGGFGWSNAELGPLPAAWGISDTGFLFPNSFPDGGFTLFTAAGLANPVYSGVGLPGGVPLSDIRFDINSISSFAANIGDGSFHSIFATFNAALFTATEVVQNAGLFNIGGTVNAGSTVNPALGPNGTAITLICEPQVKFSKDLTSGPDADDDGEIDVVVEVGQSVTTAYDFTMTYNNPGGPPVLIVDTAPAEWIVTEVGGQSVNVAECGESDAVSNGFGSVDVFKNGKLGKKCRSSTKILWTPNPDGGELNVLMETRQSPGKNNVKFAPTSCGPLFLNSGLAKVFEIDPATGEPLRDPVTGNLLPPLFTAEPLLLVAVKDVNGGGIVPNGTGNEDGDALSDLEDVLHGFDPCSTGDGILYAGTDTVEFDNEFDLSVVVDGLAATTIVDGLPFGGTNVTAIDTTMANRDFVNGLAPTGTGTLFSGSPFLTDHNEITTAGVTLSSVVGPLPFDRCCNEDLAFDGTHVWRAHWAQGPLFKYLPDGTLVDTFAQTDVVGATFVWPADQLWITKWEGRQVGTFDPGTDTFTSVFGTTNFAGGLAYDIERGMLWVGEQGGWVRAYDLTALPAIPPLIAGSTHQPFGPIDETVDGLAFIPD